MDADLLAPPDGALSEPVGEGPTAPIGRTDILCPLQVAPAGWVRRGNPALRGLTTIIADDGSVVG